MKTRSDKAVNFMLRNEDGRYDTRATLEDLNDGAGLTFIGLTEVNDTGYLDGMTITDLKTLYDTDRETCLDVIRTVYAQKYYAPIYDQIKSERLAIRLFDLGVNCGVQTSVKMLQRAVNALGVNCEPDGKFGPGTLDAVNSCDQEELLKEFKLIARTRYIKLAEQPKFSDFLNGWLNRLGRDEYEV